MQKSTRRSRFKRRLLGFTLAEVLAVATMVGAIPAGSYSRAKDKGAQTQCINNLNQIGKALEMYYMEHGEYPRAAFFPTDAEGTDSIRSHLDSIPQQMWQCPAMPEVLKNKGLTFVYNDRIAGQRRIDNPDKTWVLIELTCVTHKAPHPHPNGYNVLFASGKVITTPRLPRRITEAWEEIPNK